MLRAAERGETAAVVERRTGREHRDAAHKSFSLVLEAATTLARTPLVVAADHNSRPHVPSSRSRFLAPSLPAAPPGTDKITAGKRVSIS